MCHREKSLARMTPTRVHTTGTFTADPPSYLDGSMSGRSTPRSGSVSGSVSGSASGRAAGVSSGLSTPRSTASVHSATDDKVADGVGGRLVSLRKTLRSFDASYRYFCRHTITPCVY